MRGWMIAFSAARSGSSANTRAPSCGAIEPAVGADHAGEAGGDLRERRLPGLDHLAGELVRVEHVARRAPGASG